MATETSSSSAVFVDGTKNNEPRASVMSQRRSSVSGSRRSRRVISLKGVSTTSASVDVGVDVPTVGQDCAGVVGADGNGGAVARTKNAVLFAGLLLVEVDVNLDDAEAVAGASELAFTSHRSASR